jgi:hypothetical protein
MKNIIRIITRIIAMSALCAGAIIGMATAQKTEAALPSQLPPSLPIFSAADLAAKVPAAKPEDVKSIDAIMHAAYDAISGPAGARDWNRFRSIFLPQARFTQVGKAPDGATFVISWSVDEFIRDAGAVFAKDPFYENAIVNRADSYGNMTRVLSSYESHRSPGDKPFERGVNSFQLLNDGKRWWVVSIFWDSERPDNPLPANLAKK